MASGIRFLWQAEEIRMMSFNFEKKVSKGGPLDVRPVEKFFFRFSKFQNFFLKNGFNGTWQMLIETKS